MLTRMQPIGNVFSKFPRVVRDLSSKLKKNIDLTIVGKDVELDKTIIESINDPLTHLVRNSVDHGIETPAERKRLGKSETGLVILKAYHEAGQVVIEISDDGKGLDGDSLAASAVNKGLLTVEQAQIMSDKEKINLIFLPGFSTAKEVTDVSGRGVGMDVVKTNLDQLGGNVDIISEVGHGTTISIKLPLTLAIIPCQIIMMGGERYAIPQVNLEELLRIPANQVKEQGGAGGRCRGGSAARQPSAADTSCRCHCRETDLLGRVGKVAEGGSARIDIRPQRCKFAPFPQQGKTGGRRDREKPSD